MFLDVLLSPAFDTGEVERERTSQLAAIELQRAGAAARLTLAQVAGAAVGAADIEGIRDPSAVDVGLRIVR